MPVHSSVPLSAYPASFEQLLRKREKSKTSSHHRSVGYALAENSPTFRHGYKGGGVARTISGVSVHFVTAFLYTRLQLIFSLLQLFECLAFPVFFIVIIFFSWIMSKTKAINFLSLIASVLSIIVY